MTQQSLLFDPQDYQLLTLINQTVSRLHKGMGSKLPNLRPNGIIELSISVELRMASAVLRLLDTLDQGQSQERLEALQALYDEVLAISRTSLRINTGRVLVQIMKELVRAHGDLDTQLRLAHDFRKAATGDHIIVRRFLHRYFMLEMPEDWNQAVFDNHVHDANTKGRKNATHLIMDAWLKGIRNLTVIYYNYVSPEAARELMYAASIVGISVRIGLLFHAPHRGRLTDFIWMPRGFANNEEFLNFLTSSPVAALMDQGRLATKWLEKRILHQLETWNGKERRALASMLHTTPEPLDAKEFMTFVGSGQASLLHLAEFIHKKIFPLLQARASAIQDELLQEPAPEQQSALQSELKQLDAFTTETVLARLSDPELFPEISNLQRACSDKDCPELLRQTPMALLSRLCELRSGYRITLNLACLTTEDVLTLLWDCQGRITHLELFNLKDWQNGDMEQIGQINALQRAINDGSVPRIKQIIFSLLLSEMPAASASGTGESASSQDWNIPDVLDALSQTEKSHSPRVVKLRTILQNIPVLCEFYSNAKLSSTAGTDSTSRAGTRYGMGLAFPETLPRRARKELKNSRHSAHLLLPLRTEILEQTTYRSDMAEGYNSSFTAFLRRLPGFQHYGLQRRKEWIVVSEHTMVCDEGRCSIATGTPQRHKGNIITLGGSNSTSTNGFCPLPARREPLWEKMRYLNSRLENALHLLVGFIPAFLAFLYTQSGWMAWCGALIWFFMSGMRNILQSVLGNGGLHRSSVLHWKSYVSWSTLYTSLMYNGFSVVLLEPILRWQILGIHLGMDALTAPVTTYVVMGLTCGAFKTLTHRIHGHATTSLLADVFSTLLSIPLALLFHHLFSGMLNVMGGDCSSLPTVSVFLVKLGSDTAIGIVNGMEDRKNNMHRRMMEYSSRLRTCLALYSRLEVLFPEQNVVTLLNNPERFLQRMEEHNTQLCRDMVINALDLMYFWFYQPRANYALIFHLRRLSASERLVLMRMQMVLQQEKQISQMLVNGLIGKSFAAPLSFYLARNREYLRNMARLCTGEKNMPALKRGSRAETGHSHAPQEN